VTKTPFLSSAVPYTTFFLVPTVKGPTILKDGMDELISIGAVGTDDGVGNGAGVRVGVGVGVAESVGVVIGLELPETNSAPGLASKLW
jgi:hypothetical protein